MLERWFRISIFFFQLRWGFPVLCYYGNWASIQRVLLKA